MSLAHKTISFKALQRCRTTIEDFACTYFPLHGLDPAQGLFKYLDILLFVEATIYQMDEENESLCEQMAQLQLQQQQQQQPEGDGSMQEHTFADEAALLEVLQQQLLLSEAVRAELAAGQLYWLQERRLCGELARLAPGHEVRLTLADVLSTHESKSFDYRVMHLLLLQLLQRPPDATLLEFLRVDEMLIDIGDDLTDYEDDVMANSFNIFRGYIYLFGSEAPQHLAQRISELEVQRAALLTQLPTAMQALVLKRQRDAVEEEGGDKWCFPNAILDEPKFRREVQQLEAGA